VGSLNIEEGKIINILKDYELLKETWEFWAHAVPYTFSETESERERETQTDRGVLPKLPCQLPKLCCRRYINTVSITVLEE
jgi:hypothetical protein